MNFSLNNYILNEALSSNILREIINEPSEFFKLSKVFNLKNDSFKDFNDPDGGSHRVDSDIVKLSHKANATLKKLFADSRTYSSTSRRFTEQSGYKKGTRVRPEENDQWNTYNDGAEVVEIPASELKEYYGDMDDAELKRINKEYNELIGEIYKKARNIFKRPDPEILQNIINRHKGHRSAYAKKYNDNFIDFMSITDNNFKRLTIGELKADKKTQDKLQGKVENCKAVGLYFSAAGYFLGASSDGELVLVNPFIVPDRVSEKTPTPQVEYIKKFFADPDFYFPGAIFKTALNKRKGQYLYWPAIFMVGDTWSTREQFYARLQGLQGKNIDDLYDDMFQPKMQGSGFISTNKIIEPASNLRQKLNWGYDKDDYVYVFTPDISMVDNSTSYTAGADARRTLKDYRKDQRESIYMPAQRYNWEKDEFFRTQPYRVGQSVQRIVYFDPDTNKFRYLIIKNNGERYRYTDQLGQENIVCFSTNPDTFVDIAREILKKRKMLYTGEKAIKEISDGVAAEVFNMSKTIADIMKRCDKVAKEIKSKLKVIPKNILMGLRMLLFKTNMESNSSGSLIYRRDLEKYFGDSITEEQYKALLGNIDQEFSIQANVNIMLKAMTKIDYALNRINSQVDNYKGTIKDTDTYHIKNFISEVKRDCNDLAYSLNKDSIPKMKLMLDTIEEILSDY